MGLPCDWRSPVIGWRETVGRLHRLWFCHRSARRSFCILGGAEDLWSSYGLVETRVACGVRRRIVGDVCLFEGALLAGAVTLMLSIPGLSAIPDPTFLFAGREAAANLDFLVD